MINILNLISAGVWIIVAVYVLATSDEKVEMSKIMFGLIMFVLILNILF